MRHFEFTVDIEHSRKHNEMLNDVKRYQWGAGFFAAAFTAGAVIPVLTSGAAAWSLILAFVLGMMALGSIALIWAIPRQMGSLQHTYDTSELVPAVVADVRDRGATILALVDTAWKREEGTQPGLALRDIHGIPGVELRVGARVPAVAVCGNRRRKPEGNRWEMISPMPIAWSTSDAKTVKSATNAIPASEWQRLHQLVGRLDEVRATKENVLPL